jgi:hypothetical protein
MAKLLKNCLYNKIKLLHELSSLLWFIENHAEADAKEANSPQCHDFLDRLEKDLEKHVQELKTLICKCQ